MGVSCGIIQVMKNNESYVKNEKENMVAKVGNKDSFTDAYDNKTIENRGDAPTHTAIENQGAAIVHAADENQSGAIAGTSDVEQVVSKTSVPDEDEMIVADMSLVRKRSLFLPERIRNEGRLKGGESHNKIDPLGRGAFASSSMQSSYKDSVYGGKDSTSDLDLDSETTKWAILGTLKAAFLIGGAYIIGLGGLILLMFLAFKYLS